MWWRLLLLWWLRLARHGVRTAGELLGHASLSSSGSSSNGGRWLGMGLLRRLSGSLVLDGEARRVLVKREKLARGSSGGHGRGLRGRDAIRGVTLGETHLAWLLGRLSLGLRLRRMLLGLRLLLLLWLLWLLWLLLLLLWWWWWWLLGLSLVVRVRLRRHYGGRLVLRLLVLSVLHLLAHSWLLVSWVSNDDQVGLE